LIIGGLAALVFSASSRTIRQLVIDDACDAISVHLSCGLFGLLMAPLFEINTGVLYAWNGDAFARLGWNILGGLVLTLW
jgi:ammonia channel protein AmtB